MGNWFNLLFSEQSTVSSMRVMCMMSLIIGGIIGITGLLMNKDLSSLAILCGVFVSAAFAGKVAQKHAEEKE